MRRPAPAPAPRPPGRVRILVAPRSRGARSLLLLASIGLTGCPPAGSESATGRTSTGDPTSGSAATDSGSGSPTEASSGAPTTSVGTTASASCPDGDLDEGEDCDDGNDINGDGCNNDCRASAAQQWEYRPDERATGQVFSVAADADGTIVVGGRRDGPQRWVARFGPELVPQWTRSYGDGEPGLVRGLALGDGAIHVAGARLSDGDGHDIWVARLGPDGTLEWEDTFSGGMGHDWLTQAVVVDGDMVVTGIAFTDRIWTRRYGPDGTVQWTATVPLGYDAKSLYPLGPGLASTGDALVVGWSVYRSMDLFPELLFAYPPGGGEPSWTVDLPATSGGINAIAADPGGDLVLAVRADFAALAVRRVTDMGAVLWSSSDCSGSNGRDVAIDSQGDIVVIGDGPGATGLSIRLCKFAADGTLRWGKDIDGGAGDDLGYAVAIDPLDRVIAGGAMNDGQGGLGPWLAVFAP